MADVDVDAAEDARLRPDRVPLDRLDSRAPLAPVELREDPPLVRVGLERRKTVPAGRVATAIPAFIPTGAMPVWTAEIEVDERLVRGLLAQLGLEGARLRKLAEGWDNSVWVVDERYAFRFPQRAVAIPGLEREIAVLPKLAPLLPLPVPRPAFVGKPADGYPWPFFGAELIPGVEAGMAELDDDARLQIALELAGFLRALHAVELDEPLPHDPNGRDEHAEAHRAGP